MSDIGRSIAAAARGMVGTPFVHQGRQPMVGLDCAGLVYCSARECGIEMADFRNYGPLPDAAVLLRELGARCFQVVGAMAGDVLLFHYRRGHAAHFAVVAEDYSIVHAYEGAGGVVHTPLGRWRARIHSKWRIRAGALV